MLPETLRDMQFDSVVLTEDPTIRVAQRILKVFDLIDRAQYTVDVKALPWANDFVYLLNSRDKYTEFFMDATNSQFIRVYVYPVEKIPFIDILAALKRIAAWKEE